MMIHVLLALVSSIGLQDGGQEAVALEHAKAFEFTLGPDDPVLEGIGPSKTFRYEIESDDAVLFIWARSDGLDLVLRASLGPPTSAGKTPKPSGAAALLAGRRSEPVLEDDDSGGSTTPFLRIERKGAGTLTIQVTAKRPPATDMPPTETPSEPATETPLTIHCFEARETAVTRAAAAAGKAAIQESDRLAAAGNLEGARKRVAQALTTMLGTEGSSSSAAIAQTAWNIGSSIYRLSDQHAPKAAWSFAMDFRSRTLPEEHSNLQAARGNLALTMYAVGDLRGARALFEQALAVYSRTLPEEHPNLQTARANLAATMKALGDLHGARTLQEQVLAVRSRTLPEHHPDLQAARGNLALTMYAVGDLRGARALFEQALAVYSRTLPEDHPDLQAARGNLALTMNAVGDLQGARALEEQVLAVFSRTLPEDHPDLQTARGNLALTMVALGDLPGARALEKQVLAVYSRTLPEEHPELQGARGNLAATMVALGDLHGARALFEQVLAVYSRTLPEEHPELQGARGNLAVTMHALGDLPGARALEEQVLAVFSRTLPEDHPDLQAARGNLAATMVDLGELHGARALQEQALAVYSRTLPEEHPDLQAARGNLALTMHALGDLHGARALQEKVLAVRSRTLPEAHPDLQLARANAARSRALAGEAPGSQRLARDLAATSGKPESSERFFERPRQSEDALATTLSICAGAGVFEADPEGERLAFEMVEAERGAASIAARLERSMAGDSESIRLREEIARTNRQLSELASSGEGSSALSDLVRERDRLRRALRARLEETEAVRLLPDLNAEKIARRLAEGEAALATWRYDRWTIDPESNTATTSPSYLAWVLRPDGALRRVELGSAAAIEDAIEAWRSALGAPTRGITQDEELSKTAEDQGRAVRMLVVDPLTEAMGEASRLWIAPAEALHLVPFEALPIDKGVLGDRFEIVQLPALSELTVQAPTSGAPISLLALGGITYDGEAEALTITEQPRPSSKGASRSTLTGGESESYAWKFGVLTETRAEANAVGEYFRMAFEDEDVPEPTILTRRKASRQAFERLAPKVRYLHLATHGWFAPESVASTADDHVIDERMHLMGSSLRDQVRGLAPSLLCGLAFAGANGEADMYGRVRGVMTAEEISAMDLSGVELCVLSACETNVGLRRGGQGIASLQSALHAAGVRTAITSLWRVPDEATRELMTELYRRLWVLKEPKTKALWNAKKALREQLDREGNPIYSTRDWAGWVLSGDPD